MKKSLLKIGLMFLTSLFSIYSLKSQTVVDIIVNSPDHDTLEAAVVAAGLADDLSGTGPFTVFAPTDAAFKALPAGTIEALLADPTGDLTNILLYHVVSGKALSGDLSDGQMVTTLLGKDVKVTINGDGVFINDAKVTVADIAADNGVVHVIDAVMMPPSVTVVDIIVNSPDHDTLEAAVVAAGLADDLSGTGPFTVFAPTDAAFKALPAGTIEALLADPTGDLTNILLYHVVSGKALSGDLSDGQMVTTLLGKDVKVTINGDGVFINDAKVTVADIAADNGVVHVIDAVLIPAVATGVDPLTGEKGKLNIFPNPASSFIRFSGLNGDNSGWIKITGVTGTVVKNIYVESTSESIDITSLNAGMYFIMLDTGDIQYTGKFLVK